jgi:aspartate kinase
MIVMKFGGTSIQDAVSIGRVADIVSSRLELSPVLVFSAIGKTTRNLLDVAEQCAEGNEKDAFKDLEKIRERHFSLAKVLIPDFESAPVYQKLSQDFEEVEAICAGLIKLRKLPLRNQDNILSYGELIATEILTALLRARGIRSRLMDSRDFIITDEQFTKARPFKERTYQNIKRAVAPVCESGDVPVLQGFIGSTLQHVTTTLGFEGSDFTASMIGAALDVSVIQIWKDVPGIMTADPDICTDAFTIPTLSFDEASDLAFLGAKVLHHKTIEPVMEKGIPVHICYARDPDITGTVISLSTGNTGCSVKSIVYSRSLCTLRVRSRDHLSIYDFIESVFHILDIESITPVLTTIFGESIGLAVRNFKDIDRVLSDLNQFGEVTRIDEKATISLVGEKLCLTGKFVEQIFECLDRKSIDMISYGASSNVLTIVVDESDILSFVNRLHKLIFQRSSEERDE